MPILAVDVIFKDFCKAMEIPHSEFELPDFLLELPIQLSDPDGSETDGLRLKSFKVLDVIGESVIGYRVRRFDTFGEAEYSGTKLVGSGQYWFTNIADFLSNIFLQEMIGDVSDFLDCGVDPIAKHLCLLSFGADLLLNEFIDQVRQFFEAHQRYSPSPRRAGLPEERFQGSLLSSLFHPSKHSLDRVSNSFL